ncbi:MAG: type II secretion system protein GspG [Clostridiales bacterium]|jgi:competence protein ComGC|nr:type II secretion system protein GspG [Clostridiales bacterium]
MKKRMKRFLGMLLSATLISAFALPVRAGSAGGGEAAVCASNINAIKSAAEMYSMFNGSYPTSVNALVSSGDLEAVPKCPSGGTYSITGGKVRCSVHSAAQTTAAQFDSFGELSGAKAVDADNGAAFVIPANYGRPSAEDLADAKKKLAEVISAQ